MNVKQKQVIEQSALLIKYSATVFFSSIGSLAVLLVKKYFSLTVVVATGIWIPLVIILSVIGFNIGKAASDWISPLRSK